MSMSSSIGELVAATSWDLKDRVRYSTQSLNECQRYVRDATRGLVFAPSERTSFSGLLHGAARVGEISVDFVFVGCETEFWIHKRTAVDYYSFQFPLHGICEIQWDRKTMVAHPGEVFVIGPEQMVRKHWHGSCVQLMLRINRRALEHALASELGSEIRAPLAFDFAVQSAPVARTFPRLIESLLHELGDASTLQHPRVSSHLERTLMTLLLTGVSHNYSLHFNSSTPASGPYYVRRVEEYIRQHACDMVSIEDLVRAAGVRPRSLYYGFKRWRGITPMAYLRNTRLEIARQHLQKARTDGGTVTAAAFAAGYTHLSRFSKDYKARFGETPSQTLYQG